MATDRARRVWAALAEMFGSALTTSFGTTPPPVWQSKIAGLTDKQLQAGLRAMAERPQPFPPSLGEFVAACRGSGSPRTLGQELTDDDVRRLSGPPRPGAHGLPGGMAPVAYTAARLTQAGIAPCFDRAYICASSLPKKRHAEYLAGTFVNAAAHREYLRANPVYREQLEREFESRWAVKIDLLAAAASWPA